MLRYVFILSLVLGLAACSSQYRVPVSLDYDMDQGYIEVNNYAWLEQQQSSTSDSTLSSPLFSSGIMLNRVRDAIDKEMAQYGVVKTSMMNNPDILISIRLSTEDKVEYDSFYDFYGYYPFFASSLEEEIYFRHRYNRMAYMHGPRQYVQGTLVVDFINPDTNRMICRGTSQRPVGHLTTPAARTAFVDETVKAMIQRFAELREEARLRNLDKPAQPAEN